LTPEAQVAALVALGFPEAVLLLKPDACGRIGFADFELTNNANIRRMKTRLACVEKAPATPATEQEGARARLEDCPAKNRVRLFYPNLSSGDSATWPAIADSPSGPPSRRSSMARRTRS
jgi:hypothetical protein